MDMKELKAMIPSETVRKYILDTGWTFTDKQKAILLYNQSRLLWQEKRSCWRNLMEESTDEELRMKIEAYLRYEEQGICLFKENKDRRCVYLLKAREEGGFWDGEYFPCGYFFDWETAFKYGKRKAAPFTIEKYLVDDVEEFEDGTCQHNLAAGLSFEKDGDIRFVTRTEDTDRDEEDVFWYFIRPYFEVPNPFERGDIVKTLWGVYGIVDSTREEWEKSVARHIDSEHVDYSDVQIGIIWFDEETGTFCWGEGINPLELERYEPMDIHAEDCSLVDKLLVCASLANQGKCSMDNLYTLTLEYQKARDNADQEKQTEKAVLGVLGQGCWLTFDQVYEQVKNDFEWGRVLSSVKRLIAEGRVQTVVLCGKNQEYLCGLNEGENR